MEGFLFVSFLRAIFAILFFTMCQICVAQESIVLAVENSWSPFSDTNGNGISKDIIQAAYNSVDTEVEFIAVPYARALKMA